MRRQILNQCIYSKELSSNSQLMHFGCSAQYCRQDCISIMMCDGIIISAAIGTVDSYRFR